jgi:hypothetical protein
LLGADALAGRRMIMDMRRRTVSLEAADRGLRGHWLQVPAQLRFGNLVIVDAEVANVQTHVIIDTGAEHSFANLAFVRAIQGRRSLERPPTGTRIVSAGRPVMVENILFLPKLSIGQLDIKNVTAFVGDLHVFQLWGVMDEPALVLGMDVWGALDALAIDYRRGRVHVRL